MADFNIRATDEIDFQRTPNNTLFIPLSLGLYSYTNMPANYIVQQGPLFRNKIDLRVK